jgi:hypothetical protein
MNEAGPILPRRRSMAVRKLEKSEWCDFFDRVSKTLIGKRSETKALALALGDQVEAEWLPVLGIVYDPTGDTIEIALEGRNHRIAKPQQVFVDLGAGGLTSLQVIDAERLSQIVKLRDPLLLPPAAS